MARRDQIRWKQHRGAPPHHCDGFPNRYDIALENLTANEARRVLLLLGLMQAEREPRADEKFSAAVLFRELSPAEV